LAETVPVKIWRMTQLRYAWLFAVTLVIPAFAWTAALPDTFQTSAGAVSMTPIQHASFMLEEGNHKIYIDPSPGSLFTGYPKADLVLITDIHGDHMDPAAVSELKKDGTKIIAPAAVANTITGAEVLANGAQTTWKGWTIEAVPMYNMSRGPTPGKFYHDKGRGNGYILTFGGKRFYVAGDTEDIPEMRALKNIDVAFIPMNLPFTMPPLEAADAVKAFHPAVVYPYHYRNADKTLSDVTQFKAALAGTGIDVRLKDWYAH
jgi:L-ascorbate metabolism protein UlaG (beta-lactamase superfamily)